MRTIEEGLPILRSTPTGISAVIAADGRLLGTVPPHQASAIEVAMPLPLPPTLFSQAGNWMAGLVAGLLVALAGAIARRNQYLRIKRRLLLRLNPPLTPSISHGLCP